MTLKKHIIKAVHERDFREVLEALGKSEEFEAGNINCSGCGKVITVKNVACIYPHEGEVKVSCRSRECYESALRETA